ncbi:MAG: cytochrome ubiquinol oxidase subunit I, partial [Desulfovibrionaceae bacterium]
MEYPIWNLTTFGGGFFIALIATVHVFVAQFAVGGGLFLVLTERYAYRRESPAVLDYVKRHSLFFLLLSMVFGALTGVAIWFTIALLSPQGTIVLIHNFVFAWASEWVFFLGEIVALLVYYYGWKRLSRRDHMIVGWLYFLFAWGSLFLINGIVAFMLTPGQWITTGDFWDGFFNPTFWPQLVFRTFLSFTIAGLFGFVTATRIADDHERMRLVRLCSLWTILPFVLMVASGWWYITGLPEPQFTIAVERSHRVGLFLRDFVTLSPILVLGALLLAVRLPRKVSFPLALVVLLLGLGVSGSFEFMREAARKPFVVYGDIWSNSVEPARLAEIDERGAIACSKWAPPGLKVEDTLAAGQFLFQLECASCHSIGGPMNDILPRTAKYPLTGMDSLLTGLGRINRSMPPFAGTVEERMALATYIVEGLHG